ncbi:MAG TPA: response regulator transcription factor [Oscillospiraceae bacterium]|nr:response regulator transcription factor [Oscillospiraceae bacterium]HPF55977.1 response regulator transcription factor [Clostridiales bacterium]HPK34439.1 response regulator transcription factor [Oscillospiraceae bacterium]HPR75576.1 response regulator transcription factor [Oscillospiraceae bacterium]
MRVLIVEDEKRLAEALAQILNEHKFDAETVYTGTDGLYYAKNSAYDVIILDVMLPGMTGFEVVKQLRTDKIATPVLLLTARDEINDKVKGLDCGADDYMTKPFSPDELMARVRALSRRQGEVITDQITFADLTLDLSSYTLKKDSKSVHMGYKEFSVLRLLMANPNTVVQKETILVKVWGSDSDAEDNNVEAYISFLRKKFFYLGSKVNIGTVRKVGYRLEVLE